LRAAQGACHGHVEDFSIRRYRPMESLLSSDDFVFLASRKGFHSGIERRLRRERAVIFRRYLRNLRQDYDLLESACRRFVLAGQEDRSDLAFKLLSLRFMFLRCLAIANVRSRLYALGFNVNATSVFAPLERMQLEVQRAALAAQ
jgi:hypothetical protein